jgi:hypothetical protein
MHIFIHIHSLDSYPRSFLNGFSFIPLFHQITLFTFFYLFQFAIYFSNFTSKQITGSPSTSLPSETSKKNFKKTSKDFERQDSFEKNPNIRTVFRIYDTQKLRDLHVF